MKRRLRWPLWTCAMVTILFSSLYLASGWWRGWVACGAVSGGQYVHAIGKLSAGVGRVDISRSRIRQPHLATSGFDIGLRRRSLAGQAKPREAGAYYERRWDWGWRPYWSMKSGIATIPIWWLIFLFASMAAILFWRARRQPPGYCLKCGYDLAGITGPCPECGAES